MSFCLIASLFAASVLTNCADVAEAIYARERGARFRFTALVYPSSVVPPGQQRVLHLSDASGGVILRDMPRRPCTAHLRPGDIVRIEGHNSLGDDHISVCGRCDKADVISRQPPPPPIDASLADLQSARYDCRVVRTQGRVMEVFLDEIDPRFFYVSLGERGDFCYLDLSTNVISEAGIHALRDAEIRVVGIVSPNYSTSRRSLGRTIHVDSPKNITVLSPAPDDPFDVPDIAVESPDAAADTLKAGRRRARGTVIAVRANRRFLIREDRGWTRNVKLSKGPTPACGSSVEVVGVPVTDFYRINLTDADWRTCADAPFPDEPPIDMTPEELLTDRSGNLEYKSRLHGSVLRVTGTVVDKPMIGDLQKVFLIRNGAFTLPIDMTSAENALGRMAIGSKVAVTGICDVETETWRPFGGFPHTTGIVLVPRSDGDVAVLAAPPWWTPARLLVLIAALFLALVAILVWNKALRRLADRRGDELAAERLASLSSQLRVEERTSLAVELHDSLSQTLTGAAMEIRAAERLGGDASPDVLAHLTTAGKALQSCRDDLRNCLWDLRSRALEDADMTAAIRTTLEPHVSDSRLSVRFNVPRASLSDSTTHAILCSVRELVLNAIRHGDAKTVRVAGCVDGDRILYSVADDGCGFDPDDCPGVTQGHFGLQGIRERIRKSHGRLVIESAPGRGAKATITLPLKAAEERPS